MRLFTWLLRAFVFFALFAFALNNQQAVTVRWFFGLDWQAPLVIIVLLAFGGGCAVGVLAMVPAWWRHRQAARRSAVAAAQATRAASEAPPVPAPHGAVPATAPGAMPQAAERR